MAVGDMAVRDAARPDVMRRDTSSDCNLPLDIVFAIDTSTSMEDELDQIASGIRSVWDAASALTSNVQFGLVVFVDDVVAVNGCAPFANVDALASEFMTWRDFTSSNQQPAGTGSPNADCPENSLDAFVAAAETCPWRDGSIRLIVHATDDTFAESPTLLSGVPVQHSYAEVVEALVSRELRVGTFAAPGAGEFCGAGSSPNVGRGFHDAFGASPALPTATGGRAWSIRDVRAGTLDMAEAINALVADEYCTLY